MKRAFVTGASGFVGRNLVQRLVQHGFQVRCLVRSSSSVRFLRRMGAELCYGSLHDGRGLCDAMAGCDCVFHVAGLTQSLRRDELMHVNSDGAGQIALACSRQAQPPVLVLVSSLAAAGPCLRGTVRSEADRPAPISHYGHSKRAGELAVQCYADRVPVTILRPGVVFGPWGRAMLPAFRAIARLGVHLVPTFAPPPLSMIHAEDLADLLILAAQRGQRLRPVLVEDGNSSHAQGYYFACDDQYPDYAELGRMIGRSVGRPGVFCWHLADPFPWMVAGSIELASRIRRRAEIVNVDKMREAHASSWASSPLAARQDLGFHPAMGLADRIQATSDWYRQNRWM
jgi:nucleoside-diphosphate-sugar epimerase